MLLTALAVQNAKQRSKPYLLSDGQGLHLLITPNGVSCGGFATGSAASRTC